jgi:hypothetical protein
MTTSIEMHTFISKLIMKEITTTKFKSTSTMARWFSITPNVHDVFLLGKMNINHERKKRVKTKNLKMARNLGMIFEKEFKEKVK